MTGDGSRGAGRARRALANTLLVLGSVLGGLLLAEVAVRVFAPQVPYAAGLQYNWWRWDDDLGIILRPSHRTVNQQPEYRTRVVTNAYGFRDDPFVLRKASGVYRVLTIGDSFTFGWGVEAEQAWPSVLERELATRLRRPVEILNAGGASGFATTSQFLFLRRELDRLQPDLVVLGFTTHNDITDELQIAFAEVDSAGLPLHARHLTGSDVVNEHGMRVTQKGTPLRYRLPIVNQSHAIRLLGRIRGWRLRARGLSHARSYQRDYSPEMQAARGRVARLLAGADSLAKAHGAGFAVMVIPSIPQVDAAADPEALGYVAPGATLADMDYDQPQRELLPLLDKYGTAYLDLRPELRGALASGRRLYYRYDGHWTPAGHRVAARAFADWLMRSGLVPDSVRVST